MLQCIIAAGYEIKILDEEIRVLIITEQSDVRQNTEQQQKFSLRPLLSVHLCQAGADDVVADHAPQEKREEIRTALRIKVKGRKYQPDFRDRIVPETVQQKVAKEGYRQK